MRLLLIILFTSFCYFKAFAQTNYWIFFKSPAPVQSVNPSYLKKIASKNVKVIGTSKWFNAAYVSVNNSKSLRKIENHSFVKSIEQKV